MGLVELIELIRGALLDGRVWLRLAVDGVGSSGVLESLSFGVGILALGPLVPPFHSEDAFDEPQHN